MESKAWGILSGVALVVWLFVMSQPIVGIYTGFQVLLSPAAEGYFDEVKPPVVFGSLVVLGFSALAFYKFGKKR